MEVGLWREYLLAKAGIVRASVGRPEETFLQLFVTNKFVGYIYFIFLVGYAANLRVTQFRADMYTVAQQHLGNVF